MVRLLDFIVRMIALSNNRVVSYLNKTFNIYDDKILHFLVIGIFGIIIFLLLKPIINYLVKKNASITITFIYIFTFLIVISFAIEIGQGITGTGAMDLKDVASGLIGFLFCFMIYLIIYYVIKYIKNYIEEKNQVD